MSDQTPGHRWPRKHSPGSLFQPQSGPGKWLCSPGPRCKLVNDLHRVLQSTVRVVTWQAKVRRTSFGWSAIDVEVQKHYNISVEATLPRLLSITSLEHRLVEWHDGLGVGGKHYLKKGKGMERRKRNWNEKKILEKNTETGRMLQNCWVHGNSTEKTNGSQW